jgi:ABC-type nickel/cobalt efflux system permease component RcnA
MLLNYILRAALAALLLSLIAGLLLLVHALAGPVAAAAFLLALLANTLVIRVTDWWHWRKLDRERNNPTNHSDLT